MNGLDWLPTTEGFWASSGDGWRFVILSDDDPHFGHNGHVLHEIGPDNRTRKLGVFDPIELAFVAARERCEGRL